MTTPSTRRDGSLAAQPVHGSEPDELPAKLRPLLDHLGRILAEEYVALVDRADDANKNDTPNDQEKFK